MSIRDMVARHSDFGETKDFIPTPPFATRVLFEHVAPDMKKGTSERVFLDPAAGHGHMMGVAREYGYEQVHGWDITAHPDSGVIEHDFTQDAAPFYGADDIVTNPPYAELEGFIQNGLDMASKNFALLVRVQALETQGRYDRVYSRTPPTQIAFFSDRIPFKTGKVVRKAPKMFFHCWLYWDVAAMKSGSHAPRPPMWIPPNAQIKLQKDSDYE